CARVGYYFDYW
nr:immunoglobulin heavy chain junction region [Mus musculus]